MISLFGRMATHRIDMNQLNPDRLIWRKPRTHIRYSDLWKIDLDSAFRNAMCLPTPQDLVKDNNMREISPDRVQQRVLDGIALKFNIKRV